MPVQFTRKIRWGDVLNKGVSSCRSMFLTLVVVCLTVFLIFALSGCADAGDSVTGEDGDENNGFAISSEPINLVIIYGNHANSGVDVSRAKDKIESKVAQVVSTEGFLGIVRLDGDPEDVGSMQISLESKNTSNKQKEIESLMSQIDITGTLESDTLKAKVEEIDIFKALEWANSCFASATDPTRTNVVLVIDSGVSTKGLINFTENGVLTANADEFVSDKVKQGLVPSFSHINEIDWLMFGAVADPQKEFTPSMIKNMQSIYEAALQEACENEVKIEFSEEQMSKNDPSADLPYVTPVPTTGEVILDELNSDIHFVTNTTDFEDEEAATKSLSEYIEELIKFPDLHVVVTGYTDARAANSYPGGNEQLSYDRAQRVCDVLILNGVNENQIDEIIGGGVGNFGSDEENRCVVLDLINPSSSES